MNNKQLISLILILFANLFVFTEVNAEPQTESPVQVVAEITILNIYKSGDLLAKLTVPKGQAGKMDLLKDTEDAKKLLELWNEESKNGEIRVRMHLPSKDGKRGSYGAEIYRASEKGYLDGLKYFFLDQNYHSEVVSKNN